MKYIAGVLLLLFLGTFTFAQQPNPSPLPGTQPTFPGENPRQQTTPPDEQAPMTSNSDVQLQIQQDLSTNPAMKNADIQVTADERMVLLTGTVVSQEQHNMAIEIAQMSAGQRTIVDKIQIQHQT